MAWGPGFHLQLGVNVLENLQFFPTAIAAIIGTFPNDFLYGCISADITVGKKYTQYLQHCHRWNVGKKLLETADKDGQKACALGYISHLAADSVAHSYYVPIKTIQSFPTVLLNHAYWEMRFDTGIEKDIWELGGKVAKDYHTENDALLRSVLANTLFSFSTNKRIFNSILLLTRLQKWQQLIKTMNDISRFHLEKDEIDLCTELSNKAVFETLSNIDDSPWFFADPTGEKALKTGEVVSRNLRILYRTGKISKKDAMTQVEDMEQKFLEAICKPELLGQILSKE
ncbi:MAG: zinc dependent phospholipase C family protein [Desulfuromonadales bacterium]|nr:zinc dependent phospholipase C family protein [Desulfuromonadales bacterium]